MKCYLQEILSENDLKDQSKRLNWSVKSVYVQSNTVFAGDVPQDYLKKGKHSNSLPNSVNGNYTSYKNEIKTEVLHG